MMKTDSHKLNPVGKPIANLNIPGRRMMLDQRIIDVGNKVLAHRSEQNTICLNGFAASLLMLVVEKTTISNNVAGVCGFRAHFWYSEKNTISLYLRFAPFSVGPL